MLSTHSISAVVRVFFCVIKAFINILCVSYGPPFGRAHITMASIKLLMFVQDRSLFGLKHRLLFQDITANDVNFIGVCLHVKL